MTDGLSLIKRKLFCKQQVGKQPFRNQFIFLEDLDIAQGHLFPAFNELCRGTQIAVSQPGGGEKIDLEFDAGHRLVVGQAGIENVHGGGVGERRDDAAVHHVAFLQVGVF